MNMDNLTKPRRQSNWDWRAAGNFIGGGSGSGMLLFASIAAASGAIHPSLFLAGLLLVALGLLCVWMEIGRPLRAMNVFRHARTSWMTREALVAPPLFLCGAMAAWTGSSAWLWPLAMLALLFLYCQARIVNAAKGIPAWRVRGMVPLIVATGWTEGCGLLVAGLALAGAMSAPGWPAAALLALLGARGWAWRAYRDALSAAAAPQQAQEALNRIGAPFIWAGHAGAAALLVAAFAMPAASAPWLAGAAGLLAAGSGWLLKYTLIVQASYRQGFSLSRLPVRGSGAPTR